ncbi:MAG TPA: hypothetical protein VF574_01395 [Allosphingosinicella sp.]|jgi:hypothetical protein
MRPFTPRQRAQNEAFLEALRRTGNPRLAAASLGVHRSTYSKRRRKCAAFATRWDCAILACHAALKLGGGERPAEGVSAFRTKGGEIIVGRTRGGRLQLRRAPPGRMTEAGERHFLRSVAASANIRLSAAATGFTHSAFYQKMKKRPAFKSDTKISLTIGYDRLEHAEMERMLQALRGDPDWLAGVLVDNPLPPMSWDQAFQALCLHRNTVRLDGDRPPGRRPRIEPNPAAAFAAIGRNIDAIERAQCFERTGGWRHAHEAAPPRLPPLHQVTGWSRADPAKVRHNPKLALFGGWRIEDLEKRRRKG